MCCPFVLLLENREQSIVFSFTELFLDHALSCLFPGWRVLLYSVQTQITLGLAGRGHQCCGLLLPGQKGRGPAL